MQCLNDVDVIVSESRKLYMSKYNECLCGLNVLRNMFGYDIVTIEQMNLAIDTFNVNKENKIFGVRSEGKLHIQVVHYLFREYGNCDLINLSV